MPNCIKIQLPPLPYVAICAAVLLFESIAVCPGSEAHKAQNKSPQKHSSTRSKRERHRHHKYARHSVVARRYAYPAGLFLLQPPDYPDIALPATIAKKLKDDFENGIAGTYPASALVQSGVVSYLPLHGGIFWRRQPIQYIVMHSTESVVPQDGPHIINSWNSMGRRHAGAQYVVDRDGRIYQTVDPELATVHVNIFKTLPGINNDNSIGIEMVHAGKQQYTREQLRSVVRLAAYLLQRYRIAPENLITHRYAQQGDHTDPVAFDWDTFVAQVSKVNRHGMARELAEIARAAKGIAQQEVTVTTRSPATALLPGPQYNAGAAAAAVLPFSPPTTELRGELEVAPSVAKSLIPVMAPVPGK